VLPDIKSITRTELETRLKTWDEPAYRAGQVLDWLYQRRAASWEG
jgi:adenine C2-methylase RlmN of 23S rRNA A2503 and tRNA A37